MTSANFGILVDGTITGDTPTVLELPADLPLTDAADALAAVFAGDPDLDRVALQVGDERVGVARREHLRRQAVFLPRDVGDGDRATLPGESLRYRILRFRCRVCGAQRRRIHVDARALPLCPDGHGTLELQA
ncbi:MAG: hypothetical protein ABIS86_23140 [Streptosporangiaceae bacterium]